MEFIKQGEYPNNHGGYIILRRTSNAYIVKEWEDDWSPVSIGFIGEYRDCITYIQKQIQFLRCLHEDFQ